MKHWNKITQGGCGVLEISKSQLDMARATLPNFKVKSDFKDGPLLSGSLDYMIFRGLFQPKLFFDLSDCPLSLLYN